VKDHLKFALHVAVAMAVLNRISFAKAIIGGESTAVII